MKKKLEAWVIGGDGRYAWAARQLRRDGMPVKCWGVPGMENQAESLEMALEDADIVLLPMKPFRMKVSSYAARKSMRRYCRICWRRMRCWWREASRWRWNPGCKPAGFAA